MAVLNVNTITRAGVDEGAGIVAAGSTGDSFVNDGDTFVVLNNASGGSITVTFVIQSTVDGESVTNRTVVVPASKEYLVGPFPQAIYNDSNGRLNMTYSAYASLSVGAFNLTSN